MKQQKWIIMMLFLSISVSINAAPFVYFLQNAQSYQSPVNYGNNLKVGNYANVAGAKIYYEHYGKGQPIVVLHGGLVGSPAEMGQFIDHLVQDHHVIVINTRGHGRSEIGNELPSYTQKALDIAYILDDLSINQPVELLGFSDGAYSALTFAAQYPQRSKKVIAIGAGEWKKGFLPAPLKQLSHFEEIAQLDRRYWQQQQSIRPHSISMERWFQKMLAGYRVTQVSKETFAKIQAPVLLIVGENDQNAPLETVLSAYQLLPKAHLAVIPNTPHSTFTSNFQAVWACIVPFLAEKE